MQPRRRRDGSIYWSHRDVRHASGPYKCRSCPVPAAKPWRFYCSADCRKAFRASVPPFWPELANRIKARDKQTCQICGRRPEVDVAGPVPGGLRLEVDHIKPVALFPELEFEPANLRTLCHDCHVKHGARPNSKRWVRQNGLGPERPLTTFLERAA